MRIKSIHIKNIGLIADEVINLNKALILFYGDIKNGKTTILTAIRIAFGGAFPEDILKHGELEGHVKIETHEGYLILREFYRSEGGAVKARPLTVQREGTRIPKPVEFLKKFLNPFLLDGEYLANMPTDERKKFFVELFQIDTRDLDGEDGKLEVEAKELRAKVKAYGSLNLEKVERVDVDLLKSKLVVIQLGNQKEKSQLDAAVSAQKAHNQNISNKEQEKHDLASEMSEIDRQIAELVARKTSRAGSLSILNEWLKENPYNTDTYEAELADTSALEEEISNAKATNVRAEIYEQNLEKQRTRTSEEGRVSAIEARQREIKQLKAARLKQLSDDAGIPGLEFREGGEFSFEDTTAAMLSTSQIMSLSSHLSGLYPEGFGLELIDRAESLGKSIFDYVDRAKAGSKTILATIVGERPADVPENIGVFVVEKGKIS